MSGQLPFSRPCTMRLEAGHCTIHDLQRDATRVLQPPCHLYVRPVCRGNFVFVHPNYGLIANLDVDLTP